MHCTSYPTQALLLEHHRQIYEVLDAVASVSISQLVAQILWGRRIPYYRHELIYVFRVTCSLDLQTMLGLKNRSR